MNNFMNMKNMKKNHLPIQSNIVNNSMSQMIFSLRNKSLQSHNQINRDKKVDNK